MVYKASRNFSKKISMILNQNKKLIVSYKKGKPCNVSVTIDKFSNVLLTFMIEST